MKLFRALQTTQVIAKPCVFTFGTFDGVHLGHQYIFNQVKEEAKRLDALTACLTFSNHPAMLLSPSKALAVLTTDRQKVSLIESFGFDILINLPFDEALRALTAEQFLHAVMKMIPIEEIVVGSDVSFGNGGLGNKDFIINFTPHIAALFIERFCIDGLPVSSSRVRKALQQADFATAEKLLGRPYELMVDGKGVLQNLAVPPAGRYRALVRFDGQDCLRNCEISISSILQIYGIEYTKEFRFAEVRLLERII